MFRVIVAGGRDFSDYNLLCQKLNLLLKNKHKEELAIICGMANGADLLGRQWAIENKIKVLEFPADWNKFGKSAGYRRNTEMANNADALIVFWDSKSRGTSHMINIARERLIPTRIVKY